MIMFAMSPSCSFTSDPQFFTQHPFFSSASASASAKPLDDSGFFDDAEIDQYYAEVLRAESLHVAKSIGTRLTKMCDDFDAEFMNPTPIRHKLSWIDSFLQLIFAP